ncbi:MAG: hypothetical protein CTY19_11520 [Methylomonas sp.]|nr:MAG: hypothetical protein CTY19_11520 [Methylomonas sp.]
MTLNMNELTKSHIFQNFDHELAGIHSLAVEMMNFVLHQWEMTIDALDDANLESALNAFAMTNDVREYEDEIYQAILKLLAKENPVASDLRMMLSVMKVSVTMKYMAEEVAEIAKLIVVLYEPRNGSPTAQLTNDVIKLSQDILHMLNELVWVMVNLQANPAYMLLQHNYVSGSEVQEAVKHQIAFVTQDRRQMRPALTTLQIVHSMETCAKHCKNLAEYCVFMIEGNDIRHTN